MTNKTDKKILFFDIDGTILSEETNTIPPSALNAIARARENGHLAFINTGRPYATIDQMIKDVGFDGFVCGCGTNIYFQGNEIYHQTLEEDIRRKIINLAYLYKVDCMLEGKTATCFKEEMLHPFMAFLKDKYLKEGHNILTYPNDSALPFDKFTVWYTPEGDIESFKDAIKDEFTIIQRADDFIEVVPKNCSKASGIDFLTDYLDMSHDSTISFGDSTNDLSMLIHTKESVAMGNSNPILFDKVTYITTDVDDNGIENALKHFKVID